MKCDEQETKSCKHLSTFSVPHAPWTTNLIRFISFSPIPVHGAHLYFAEHAHAAKQVPRTNARLILPSWRAHLVCIMSRETSSIQSVFLPRSDAFFCTSTSPSLTQLSTRHMIGHTRRAMTRHAVSIRHRIRCCRRRCCSWSCSNSSRTYVVNQNRRNKLGSTQAPATSTQHASTRRVESSS